MADAVKLRDTDHFKQGQRRKNRARRRKNKARKDAKEAFEGKTFEALTDDEKDDLLKRLAIGAGIIDE